MWSRVSPSLSLLALAALLAAASAQQRPSQGPPQELCSTKLTLTDVYNPSSTVLPTGALLGALASAGVDLDDDDNSVGQQQPVNVSLTGIMTATTDPVFLGPNATASNTNQTVGNVTSVCITLTADPTQSLGYCTNTIVFGTYGDIAFLGPFLDNPNATFYNPVVGGTGIFNGASGTVNVTVLEKGNRWRYDIALLKEPTCSAA